MHILCEENCLGNMLSGWWRIGLEADDQGERSLKAHAVALVVRTGADITLLSENIIKDSQLQVEHQKINKMRLY